MLKETQKPEKKSFFRVINACNYIIRHQGFTSPPRRDLTQDRANRPIKVTRSMDSRDSFPVQIRTSWYKTQCRQRYFTATGVIWA